MIGILDSGLGGLSALMVLRTLAPKADLLYLSDQAHLPYGEKSPEDLCHYLKDALAFFEAQKVEAVLVACGTLSGVALPHLKTDYPFPIFGVITPAAKHAKHITKTGHVAVIATSACVLEKAYTKALRNVGIRRVYERDCPLFVPLVEQGITGEHPLAREASLYYLSSCFPTSCDTLLLGCTHYPFLASAIQKVLPHITLLDAGRVAVVEMLKEYPKKEELGRCDFYTTACPATFQKTASRLLGELHGRVAHIHL